MPVQNVNIRPLNPVPETTPVSKKGLDKDTFINSRSVLKPNSKLETKVDAWLVHNAPRVFMSKYLNSSVVENAMQANPKIAEILMNKGLQPTVYIKNIQDKNQEHFISTYNNAKELGQGLSDEEYTILLQAALLHDIGKALIPSVILNKPSKLTDVERNIVDMHAELGSEILKTTNIDPKVIEQVELHHMGYADSKKINNISAQILSACDVDSALREKRPYKDQFPEEKVKEIMLSDPKLNPKITAHMFKPKIHETKTASDLWSGF